MHYIAYTTFISYDKWGSYADNLKLVQIQEKW